VVRSIVKLWAFVLLLDAAGAAHGQANQEKAIAAVKALGGQVTVEPGDPARRSWRWASAAAPSPTPTWVTSSR
jgi:hypothetical protein